jgi:hypothetical protein
MPWKCQIRKCQRNSKSSLTTVSNEAVCKELGIEAEARKGNTSQIQENK